MRLTGKDREVHEQLLEDAHRKGDGDAAAVDRYYLAGLDELAGLGVGWAAERIERCKLAGARTITRPYRRRSFLPSQKKRRGKPLRVPAYVGARRIESMPLGAVIASAAADEAAAYTLLAVAKEKRRLVSEAEESGRSRIGEQAA